MSKLLGVAEDLAIYTNSGFMSPLTEVLRSINISAQPWMYVSKRRKIVVVPWCPKLYPLDGDDCILEYIIMLNVNSHVIYA